MRTACSDEVSALVRQGEAALGLRYFPDPSPGVISRLVHNEALAVVYAADARLVDRNAIEATSLIGVPWLGFPAGPGSSGEPFAHLLQQRLMAAGL